MSEYWKSNPRKFCDFCKCWIADNKPSIDFHERGKRHKENVQTRLAEMGRKGQEDYEAKLQEKDFLKAMEEAAMKAYKTDIEQNPDMTGVKISEIAKASNAELVVGKQKLPDPPAPKAWREAKSPEGTSYYWNTKTGESSWDAPKEGFLSLKEQEETENSSGEAPSNSTSNNTSVSKAASNSTSNNTTTTTNHNHQKTLSSAPVTYGPAPKAVAYSSWQTIQIEPKQQPDLQLPEIVEEEYYGPEVVFKKPESSFKEKVVTLSSEGQGGWGGGGAVGFKKRKAHEDNRKIMKRRNDL